MNAANAAFEAKLRYTYSPKNYKIVHTTTKKVYTIEVDKTSRLIVQGFRSLHVHLGNIIMRLIKESNKMCEGHRCDILKSGLCGVNSSRIPRCSYSDRPCRPAGRPDDLSRWLYRGRVARRLNYDRTK